MCLRLCVCTCLSQRTSFYSFNTVVPLTHTLFVFVKLQSGRLADKKDKLEKGDMLEMIQFGAEKMFRSKEATITDEDIDTLLSKGEEKTKEGLNKLKSLGDVESLQSFTFDTKPEKKLMEFEGQDFRNQNTAFTWIAPPKRDRKVTFIIVLVSLFM